MKHYLLIVPLLFALVACVKKEPKVEEVIRSTVFFISVQDSAGADLLNPENEGAFHYDSITISHLMDDGSVQRYDCPSCDNDKGIRISEGDATKLGIIYFALSSQNDLTFFDRVNPTTTYIRWNSSDTDTVYSTFLHREVAGDSHITDGYVIHTFDKIFFNDRLIFDSSLYSNFDLLTDSWGAVPVIVK